jgi:ribose 5-phosphate isomerase B
MSSSVTPSSTRDAEFGELNIETAASLLAASGDIAVVIDRAGVIRDDWDAEITRRHNDANIACFGERVTDPATAIAALRIFLTTEFEGGRHESRVELLSALDEGAEI